MPDMNSPWKDRSLKEQKSSDSNYRSFWLTGEDPVRVFRLVRSEGVNEVK